MIPGNPPELPTSSAAGQRLLQLEQEYSISIKMWLTLEDEGHDRHYFTVHVSGSGEVFDLLPGAAGHASARVISAFRDPLASALWHCLDLLEHSIKRGVMRFNRPPSQ